MLHFVEIDKKNIFHGGDETKKVKLEEDELDHLSWITYVMLILASYRLTHLIVFDKITEFIRRPFVKKVDIKTETGTKSKEVPTSMFGYLLKCYWCAGIWSAIFLGGMYLLFPKIAFVLILILSIAGGQSILETFVGVNIKKVEYYSKSGNSEKK